MSRPSPATWRAISKLLDQALDLPDEARRAWLADLAGRNPAAAAAVGSWLEEYVVMDAGGFLADTPVVPVASPLTGLAVGVYRLIAPIGHGGMGTVWLAGRSDGQFEQQVAVKLLNAALIDPSGTERFAREAAILARLTHPSISRLLDAGMSSIGAPYLVLEYVSGLTIDRYCDEARLSVRDRLYLFLDVLAPVGHAHANLIVHRDLKPANVLVTPERHVKLLDFGIAKLLHTTPDGPTLPGTRDHALTPAYAAPEQLTGGAITTATDVYALGVLLYQLLSGRHPSVHNGMTPAALVDAIVQQDPPALENAVDERPADGLSREAIAATRGTTPARLRQDLSGDLATILAKTLKKAPDERYASVAALEHDLRRYLRYQPIAARPDTLRYRAARFARRHRVPVAFAAVAFLALAGGLAGTITQAQLATAQARRADQHAAEATAQRDVARRQLARAEALNDLNAFLIADAAPVGAVFTARELLERAEQIVTRQADDADGTRIESLLSIGGMYQSIGETTHAIRLQQEAYDAAGRHDDPVLRARASCGLGRSLVKTGDLGRARQLIADGLHGIPAGAEFGLARALCHLDASGTSVWADDATQAVADAEAARVAAADSGVLSPLLSLKISMQQAEALRMADRDVDANAAFAAAYDQLVALGRKDTERAGTLLNNWGLLLSSLGRARDAERMLRRSIAISMAGGSDARVEAISWSNLARMVFDLGRYDEAIALAERAMRQARLRGDTVVADQAQLMAARAHSVAGHSERSRALLDDVEARFRSMFPPTHAAFAAVATDRVRATLEAGDLVQAARLADETVHFIESEPRLVMSLSLALRHRAMVHLRGGRYAQALVDIERLLPMVRKRVPEGVLSTARGNASLVLAEALVGLGRRDEARVAVDEALRHLEDAGGPTHPGTQRARALRNRL